MKNFVLCVLICLTSTIILADENIHEYFSQGEKLTFKVKFGVVSAGEAALQIQEEVYGDSTAVYRITSLAKTNSFFDKVYKVRDNITSIWDKKKLSSRQFTKRLHEGSYRQLRIHSYYPEQGFTFYKKYDFKKRKMKESRMDIAGDTQDILSAFYWIRQRDLEVGKSEFVNVTADGVNYNAEVKVHKIETIDTPLGEKECFLIEPILKGEAIFKQTGKIFIWITNDEKKIPVKLRSKFAFGSFYAILEKIEKNRKDINE